MSTLRANRFDLSVTDKNRRVRKEWRAGSVEEPRAHEGGHAGRGYAFRRRRREGEPARHPAGDNDEHQCYGRSNT
jgi:hypothetical protein